MIICVSEIWDDPGMNSVNFVDISLSDPVYVRIIRAAMNDKRKVSFMSGDDYDNICNNIVTVNPPCHAQDSVTIYVD